MGIAFWFEQVFFILIVIFFKLTRFFFTIISHKSSLKAKFSSVTKSCMRKYRSLKWLIIAFLIILILKRKMIIKKINKSEKVQG